jgi:glycerol transport system ATP-binding protein
MLLDEPLVNLDYKLREELREELCQLFASGESTVVYATTEPAEALLLGGWTAVMDQGELLQYGPTAEVFHHPRSIRVARAFSDPPMNLLAALATEAACSWPAGRRWPWPAARDRRELTVGVRASAARGPARGRRGPGRLGGAGRDLGLRHRPRADRRGRAGGPAHRGARGRPGRAHHPARQPDAELHVFDARGELLLALNDREGAEMARIELDLAHAYKPSPRPTATTPCCRCR